MVPARLILGRVIAGLTALCTSLRGLLERYECSAALHKRLPKNTSILRGLDCLSPWAEGETTQKVRSGTRKSQLRRTVWARCSKDMD